MRTLRLGLQLLVTIFAALHGFVFRPLPEEVRQSSSIGIGPFVLLLIFLLVAYLARRKRGKQAIARYREWMVVVAACCLLLGTASFFFYQREANELTFRFPPGEPGADLYLKGKVLTYEANIWKSEHPEKTDSDLVDSFGGVDDKDRVWTQESIGQAEIELTASYLTFVVILTAAALCLLEVLPLSRGEAVVARRHRRDREVNRDLEAQDGGGQQKGQGGITVDAITIITLIGSGLKLIDSFRELAIRIRGEVPAPPRAKAEQVGSALEVREGDHLTHKIEATQLRLDQWEAPRYAALEKRVKTNWLIYNDLFVSEAKASAQEGARIRADMVDKREELCSDFREMVGIYEGALGVGLPDHYKLFEVCQ